MKKNRWAIKLALCLLAGAVVTWVVAWGCVPLDSEWDEDAKGAAQFPDGWHDAWMCSRFGASFVWLTAPANPGPPLPGSPRFIAPHWVHWSGGASTDVRTYAFGWPARSLYGVVGISPGTPLTVLTFKACWIDLGSVDSFPAGVVVTGFTLNTLFYAGAVLMGVEGIAFARPRRARSRGRCPSCGYDRRGLAADAVACPECGTV